MCRIYMHVFSRPRSMVKELGMRRYKYHSIIFFLVMVAMISMTYWLKWNKEQFASFFCEKTHFSKEPLPVTALASYFGSGNTWTRQIIEKATGIYTGCDYVDEDLKQNGFLGENITDGSTVVVKTHEWSPITRLQHFQKAILLIRNPYEAILSNFHLRHSKSHTGMATNEDFRRDWDKYVEHGSEHWLDLNLTWLKFKGPLHIIHYESLKQNFKTEVTYLIRFLNFPVYHNRMMCAMAEEYEKYHRKQSGIQAISLYSVKQREKLDKYILTVEREIRRRQQNPLLQYV